MNIVFFVHCFFPHHFYGTETYTLALAKRYQEMGHKVTVVTAIFQGEQTQGELVINYEFQGIPVVSIDKNLIPHARVKETYYQAEMHHILEQVLRKLSPDVVHTTHLINHTAVLLEVTQKLGIPTYATFTDFYGFCLNNKLEAANGGLCAGPSASRTNCVACHIKDTVLSPYANRWMQFATTPIRANWLATTLNAARRLPGLRGGSIDGLIEDIARRPKTLASLYNAGYKTAIAPTKFLQSAYVANGIQIPMRTLWFGVDIDRKPKPIKSSNQIAVIGYIGQIAPHKGTDLLIEAFARLPKGPFELRIYGPADQDVAYMEKLKSLAEGYEVNFMGTFAKEQMVDVYEEIDLLVIPSRWYENSPLVLLNALATHTPVLVSDVAGMTEFLEPGVNGESFERGNIDDLELKLRELVETKYKLESLAKTTSYDRTSLTMAAESFKIYSAI